MEEKVLNWIDKSEWGPGPWQTEPDKIEFRDEETGLPCIIRRNHYGVLCGYVAVPEDHTAFDASYHDVEVEVHGGLTYSSRCQEENREHGICHTPRPGDPDNVYWLGFDCGHAFDFSPGMAAHERKLNAGHSYFQDGVYRDISYLRQECRNLALQLSKMGTTT